MSGPGVVDINTEIYFLFTKYVYDPVAFVVDMFDVTPDDWQKKALKAMAEHNRLAIRSGHGVGKTTFLSWLILWFIATRPNPKIPCTAPTEAQLSDILWPEIAKWLDRSPLLKSCFEWQKTRIINKAHPERWFATQRTSNKPENLAGFHEDHLLFIVDEGSGVPDPNYEVIEGALTGDDNKLVVCGNPTKTSGEFYNAFHRARKLYYTMKVSCLDSNLVSNDYVDRLITKYGEDSDIVRVRGLGEFPKSEPDTFIQLEVVEAAVDNKVEPGDFLEMGVDVARYGNDETVIAIRQGLKLIGLKTYNKQGTMETCGHVLRIAQDAMISSGLNRCTIKIDDSGIGGGVTDRLKEVIGEMGLLINVVPCINNAAASNSKNYKNWGTESWAVLRDLLVNKQIQLINDEDLIGQLSCRKYKMTSSSQIELESKDSMRKRHLKSPDRADAVVLCFAPTIQKVMLNLNIDDDDLYQENRWNTDFDIDYDDDF